MKNVEIIFLISLVLFIVLLYRKKRAGFNLIDWTIDVFSGGSVNTVIEATTGQQSEDILNVENTADLLAGQSDERYNNCMEKNLEKETTTERSRGMQVCEDMRDLRGFMINSGGNAINKINTTVEEIHETLDVGNPGIAACEALCWYCSGSVLDPRKTLGCFYAHSKECYEEDATVARKISCGIASASCVLSMPECLVAFNPGPCTNACRNNVLDTVQYISEFPADAKIDGKTVKEIVESYEDNIKVLDGQFHIKAPTGKFCTRMSATSPIKCNNTNTPMQKKFKLVSTDNGKYFLKYGAATCYVSNEGKLICPFGTGTLAGDADSNVFDIEQTEDGTYDIISTKGPCKIKQISGFGGDGNPEKYITCENTAGFNTPTPFAFTN